MELAQFFSPTQWQIILNVASIAQMRGWRVYAVGGIIRDFIMIQAHVNSQSKREFPSDIDLVVDGSEMAGIEVAIEFHAKYPDAKLQIHPKFQTAVLDWSNFSLDLATARTEIYAYPGANPQVQASTIQQDLDRRDFTINALAIEIESQAVGLRSDSNSPDRIIDLFGGLADLSAGLIRAIRVGSFAEDPRRMFRAVRFAVRFGFKIAPETEAEIRATTASGLHDMIGGSRLKAELFYTLKSDRAEVMFQSIQALGILRCVHPNLTLPADFNCQLRRLRKWWQWFGNRVLFAQVGLELLLSNLSPSDSIETNLELSPEQNGRQQKLANLLVLLPQLDSQSQNQPTSQKVLALQSYDVTSLILAAAKSSVKQQRRILWQYLTDWRHIKPWLSGDEVKQIAQAQGRSISGKNIGTILQKIRAATLDRKITTDQAAIQAAIEIMNEQSLPQRSTSNEQQ